MKSPEVYAQLRTDFGPWFKSAGFKRAKGLLGWTRPHENAQIVIWCQISQEGWDAYAGSKFIVEFQRSREPVIGAHPAHRQRFGSLLSAEEREEVRKIQNEIVTALHHPPASHPSLHVSPDVTAWYLAKFKPVGEPYPERADIWLRYAAPEHISQWSQFILSKLPKFVKIAMEWSTSIKQL